MVERQPSKVGDGGSTPLYKDIIFRLVLGRTIIAPVAIVGDTFHQPARASPERETGNHLRVALLRLNGSRESKG